MLEFKESLPVTVLGMALLGFSATIYFIFQLLRRMIHFVFLTRLEGRVWMDHLSIYLLEL